MRVFAVWFEDANGASVQSPHYTDARKHRRPSQRHHQDQRLHGGLPLSSLVNGPWKLCDVGASILQRDERGAARQRDGIVERAFPTLAANDVWVCLA
jgi:hypothetical protein